MTFDELFRFLDARRAYFVIALVTFGLLGVGLYMQHVVGLQPCPLCIFQRFAFLAVGLLSLLAAVVAPRSAARWIGALVLLAALTGLGIAGRHVWLQANPEALACGPGLETMLENFPLTQVLPKVFRGSGDCAEKGWVFLGLSIAGWSMVWFAILSVAAIATYFRPLVRK